MQVAGSGYRFPIAVVQREFDRTAKFRDRVLGYAQHQSIAANQIAACNRLHRAEARFARWLLMVADRLGTDDITITQEFLSNMLGTRRTTVAEVGSELGRAGVIESRRGGLRIVNRPLLEQRVCECYAILRARYDALYRTRIRLLHRGSNGPVWAFSKQREPPACTLGIAKGRAGARSSTPGRDSAGCPLTPPRPRKRKGNGPAMSSTQTPPVAETVSETVSGSDLDQLSINTLRLLAVDQVEKAKNGHPGAPLGCAPIAYLLFHKFMKYNPTDPLWSDRDRFVLSNGHASALQYGVLHLAGYDLPLDQLENFREWGSHTPGHPEYGETPGVEVTTGPLGQGLAEAVGLAIAEKHLEAVYNTGESKIVDHYTYVLCGDGDLMEGISHESCSLAGTLQLGKLIVLYDDNLISLDGPTDLSFTEDVTRRFEGYDWHVQFVSDGNDLAELNRAIEAAKMERTKPSLIRVRTVIGYGSPKQGTKGVHGEALGAEATKATKKFSAFLRTRAFTSPKRRWRTGARLFPRAKRRRRSGRPALKAIRRRIRNWQRSTPAAPR